jgi:hypothetical protein
MSHDFFLISMFTESKHAIKRRLKIRQCCSFEVVFEQVIKLVTCLQAGSNKFLAGSNEVFIEALV